MLNFLDMFWKFLDLFWKFLDLALINEYFSIQLWIKVHNFLQFLHCSGVSLSFRNAVTVELFIPRLCFSFDILY